MADKDRHFSALTVTVCLSVSGTHTGGISLLLTTVYRFTRDDNPQPKTSREITLMGCFSNMSSGYRHFTLPLNDTLYPKHYRYCRQNGYPSFELLRELQVGSSRPCRGRSHPQLFARSNGLTYLSMASCYRKHLTK